MPWKSDLMGEKRTLVFPVTVAGHGGAGLGWFQDRLGPTVAGCWRQPGACVMLLEPGAHGVCSVCIPAGAPLHGTKAINNTCS